MVRKGWRMKDPDGLCASSSANSTCACGIESSCASGHVIHERDCLEEGVRPTPPSMFESDHPAHHHLSLLINST